MNLTVKTQVRVVTDDQQVTPMYPMGDILTREAALGIIRKARFVQAVWRKRDGSVTTRNIKCMDAATPLKDSGTGTYLPVVDIKKLQLLGKGSSWINLKVDSLIGIAYRGKFHVVR
jgi:hypothetical protein